MPAASTRAAANVLIGAAGATVVYVVVTTPSLRRLALRAARVWVGAVLPVFLLNRARAAWVHSEARARQSLCGAAMGRDSDPRLT
jgi:hypothetical protein